MLSIKEKEEYYMIIKGSIHQENTILNMYAPNNKAFKMTKQKLLEPKREFG